jgi:hypothetical protein
MNYYFSEWEAIARSNLSGGICTHFDIGAGSNKEKLIPL